MAYDAERGLGGKLVADRDGGCDALTGRPRRSPKVAVIVLTRQQQMDPTASLSGFLTRGAIIRRERAASSLGQALVEQRT